MNLSHREGLHQRMQVDLANLRLHLLLQTPQSSSKGFPWTLIGAYANLNVLVAESSEIRPIAILNEEREQVTWPLLSLDKFLHCFTDVPSGGLELAMTA
jgi:hypothetical protein